MYKSFAYKNFKIQFKKIRIYYISGYIYYKKILKIINTKMQFYLLLIIIKLNISINIQGHYAYIYILKNDCKVIQ